MNTIVLFVNNKTCLLFINTVYKKQYNLFTVYKHNNNHLKQQIVYTLLIVYK